MVAAAEVDDEFEGFGGLFQGVIGAECIGEGFFYAIAEAVGDFHGFWQGDMDGCPVELEAEFIGVEVVFRGA